MTLWGGRKAALFTYLKLKGAIVLKRERYEKRLFRIFAQAGYAPAQILTVSTEEMVEIPGITVPNIRTVLCLQKKLVGKHSTIRRALWMEEFLRATESAGQSHG